MGRVDRGVRRPSGDPNRVRRRWEHRADSGVGRRDRACASVRRAPSRARGAASGARVAYDVDHRSHRPILSAERAGFPSGLLTARRRVVRGTGALVHLSSRRATRSRSSRRASRRHSRVRRTGSRARPSAMERRTAAHRARRGAPLEPAEGCVRDVVGERLTGVVSSSGGVVHLVRAAD
jgi:hypothetical protein